MAAACLACVGAIAQGVGETDAGAQAASSAPRTEREVQRQRLAREQAQADAQHQAEQARCRQRFAETDCMRDAQQRYNRTRAEIRRKEVLLNDDERSARVDTKRADLAVREQQRERDEDRAARPEPPLREPGSLVPAGTAPRDGDTRQQEQTRRAAQRDAEAARRAEQAEHQRAAARDRQLRAQQREATRTDKPAASLAVPP